ncbi:MAG: FAD-dependent oxidoreductase [Salinibacter sp.]|uniref:FAD-dependent oxidoreductase n=1 Tax=Salinibacter sp. TaxID=2065818 RepID=UPI0035D407F9
MSTEVLPDGTFKLRDSVELPDVLDMLIVGGGPAGTAAAFRAKELGLDALVIDYDDLMKRIRDYAKDKLILPHFGGGDKMKFPEGDELISCLHFDPIDKDDMCEKWKGFYREYNVPAKVGVELTDAEPRDEGGWEAVTWNHKTKEEERYLTRHLVIAMGRGVPRRFDIPGNTDGIAHRLDDPENYVGPPTCVIGGGTSAAEAVIAVSNAKEEADDDCPVYWSYRGEQMPKVSKALSEEFFDAYVRNGNIRYLPNSEPELVSTGPDRNEFLSLRIDRKELEGRPIEKSHLEFPKEHCIACIGEDIPEDFLNSLGVHMVKGGPKNKKRMAVTPLLETEQPNLYLIGDILSQAYLETDDFDADPDTYQEIKHRGNIKSALRDGVFIAEVVKQKVEGRQTIQVDLTFADEEDDEDVEGPEEESASFVKTMVGGESPTEEDGSEDRSVETEEAVLVRITPGGVEEEEFSLRTEGATTIGRTEGDLTFPEDNRLSSPHASVTHTPDGYVLRDDGSSTGTFLKLQPGDRTEMSSGDLLQVGRQFLVFGREDGRPHIVQYDQTGQKVDRYVLSEGSFILGRQAPDIVLDPDDKILSRRHLAVEVLEDGTVTARDLDSLNGSFLRVREGMTIEHDDVFRVGQQLFRLSLEEVTPASSTVFRMEPDEAEPEEEAADEEVAPSDGEAEAPTEPSVTVQPDGTTVPVEDGQTVLDAIKGEGLVEYECESGFCGMDALRVVSGGEHLSAPGDQEEDTLETLCDLEPGNEPGQCRLACMAEATGPVVVERADE